MVIYFKVLIKWNLFAFELQRWCTRWRHDLTDNANYSCVVVLHFLLTYRTKNWRQPWYVSYETSWTTRHSPLAFSLRLLWTHRIFQFGWGAVAPASWWVVSSTQRAAALLSRWKPDKRRRKKECETAKCHLASISWYLDGNGALQTEAHQRTGCRLFIRLLHVSPLTEEWPRLPCRVSADFLGI